MSTTSTDRQVDHTDSQVGAQFDAADPAGRRRPPTDDRQDHDRHRHRRHRRRSSSPAASSPGAPTSPTTTSMTSCPRRTSPSPTRQSLTEEGRADLVKYAGEQVTTGAHAEAYASFIDGHLEGIADGQTYADLGTVERAATGRRDRSSRERRAAGRRRRAAGHRPTRVTAQRDTLFKGETLRGLLLSAFAWSTVGMIAGYAAIGAFIAAGMMAVLVVLGIVHLRRTPATT